MKLYKGMTFKGAFNWQSRNGLNTLEHIYQQNKGRRRAYFKSLKQKGH